MKLNDVVLEAASPAQQAAIAVAMKKAGKKPKQGVAEGKDEKIAQLKQDYKTAMHWSENERSPQKREAARQKAEKIKAHLEKQYNQGVAESFSDVVKGIKRKVAGKEDPKEVEHTYGRIARSAIKHKTPDQAEKDIKRWEKVNKVVNKEGVAEGSLEEDKGMTGYNAFKREWRAKHGADAKVPAYDSKEYTSYVYRQNDKKQGVAEGSESDAYGNTGEKHECGSCDGTGIVSYDELAKAAEYDDVCPECGGKGWVRDKESLKKKGVAEDAVSDFIARGGQIQQGKLHKPRKGETWQGSSHIGAAGGRGTKGTVSGKAANTNPKGGKPVVSAEGYNPEYDDEAGMADNNLETLERAVEGIDDLIQSGDNLPEWCQEKIAVAKSMLVAVWDYMYSEEASDEVDPEVDEMFEAMQELVAEMAVKNRVSEDLVWEQFEAMPDNVLYETAAWRRKEGKSKKGGLNAKGVASYRRENPGSKLQMAVTTKPSKLKKGSKAAKRRKSFCARMSGVKGPMKKPNGKPTRKALALRKWNC